MNVSVATQDGELEDSDSGIGDADGLVEQCAGLVAWGAVAI